MNFPYKAGSLFTGIGGFCLGFEYQGFKTIWAIENDPASVNTYMHNVNDVRIVHINGEPASITDVSAAGSDLEPVDVLHAGFPCQSFSQAGGRKGFDDPRGKLFYEIIRIIKGFKDKRPPVLILENAPYLRHGDGGSWFIEVKNDSRPNLFGIYDLRIVQTDVHSVSLFIEMNLHILLLWVRSK